MGLDMYLKATKYTYTSEYEGREGCPTPKRDAIEQVIYGIEVPKAFEKYGSREFSCTAMYWRKANAIHDWFVTNVQDGVDDCKSYYVSEEQLTELLDVVSRVIDNPDEAEELLPTCSGCFFGRTEYDQWYMDILIHTQDRLNQILSMPDLDDWSFEYQSSW